jgi:hypothetical protein
VTIVISSSGLSFFDYPFGILIPKTEEAIKKGQSRGTENNGYRTNKRKRIPKTEGAIKKGQPRVTDNNGQRTNKRWRIPKG